MSIQRFLPSNWFRQEEGNKDIYAGHNDLTPREAFHSRVDRMFDDFFNSFWTGLPASMRGTSNFLKPCLDLHETDKEYTVAVELPGVDEKDINIELQAGNTLLISGEKKSEHEEGDKEKGNYRSERSYGSFRRMLTLPEDANVNDIGASYKKGVLTITIPRAPAKNTKKIEISKG